jgi:hypothetical protein
MSRSPDGHLIFAQVSSQQAASVFSTDEDADAFRLKPSLQLKVLQVGWQQFASVITVSSFLAGFNAEPSGQT